MQRTTGYGGREMICKGCGGAAARGYVIRRKYPQRLGLATEIAELCDPAQARRHNRSDKGCPRCGRPMLEHKHLGPSRLPLYGCNRDGWVFYYPDEEEQSLEQATSRYQAARIAEWLPGISSSRADEAWFATIGARPAFLLRPLSTLLLLISMSFSYYFLGYLPGEIQDQQTAAAIAGEPYTPPQLDGLDTALAVAFSYMSLEHCLYGLALFALFAGVVEDLMHTMRFALMVAAASLGGVGTYMLLFSELAPLGLSSAGAATIAYYALRFRYSDFAEGSARWWILSFPVFGLLLNAQIQSAGDLSFRAMTFESTLIPNLFGGVIGAGFSLYDRFMRYR